MGPYYAGMPWDVAVRCPRCEREASFTPPSYTLFDDDARAARDDLSITGMGDDHYYRVIRYPKLLPWSHPSNREYNGVRKKCGASASVRLVDIIINTSLAGLVMLTTLYKYVIKYYGHGIVNMLLRSGSI